MLEKIAFTIYSALINDRGASLPHKFDVTFIGRVLTSLSNKNKKFFIKNYCNYYFDNNLTCIFSVNIIYF